MAYTTPMHDLIIDIDLCGDALPCLKCVHACIDHGHNCIMYLNRETPVVTEDWPKSLQDIPHMVKPKRMIECDGCMKCVEVCPKKAITFVPAKRHLPRAKVNTAPYHLNAVILKDGRRTWDDDYEEEIIYIDD